MRSNSNLKSIILIISYTLLIFVAGCNDPVNSYTSSVVDKSTQTSLTTEETATAEETQVETDSVTVAIRGFDGALLNDASVTIDDTIEETEQTGYATLVIPALEAEEEIVIQASEDGFINQSIVITQSNDLSAQLVMQAVKQTIYIDNIEDQQEIVGDYLGATINLPASALITTIGEAATGAATLQLTPWDITNSELTAMLGNGQAIDSDGNRVELISAGMMTIDFYDSQGNYLQLADGMTATIEMDLQLESINNQALAEGTTIPLWHFDEQLGLWIEDDDAVGEVIDSSTSDTGLAISASVSHFSTWNWDFKWENGGTVDVSCVNADGSATSCDVIASVTLDDGSSFTKSESIPEEGATIINMPTNATIAWSANSFGLMGSATSNTSGTVEIMIEAPTTQNFVICVKSGIPTACDVTLENGDDDYTYSIPASGATISTALEDVTILSWTATSGTLLEEEEGEDIFVSYSGSVSSDIYSDVLIDLENKTELSTAVDTVELTCIGEDDSSISCTVSVDIWTMEDGSENIVDQQVIVKGETYSFNVPDGISVNAAFDIKAVLDSNGYYTDEQWIKYEDLTEQITLQLYESAS